MADALAPVRARFLERAGASPAWGAFAFEAPRLAVTAALAATPALVLLAALAVGGGSALRTATDPELVRNAFGRFESGIVAGASIAASVAVLSLHRELRSIDKLREHAAANREFRDRVRHASRAEHTPLALGALLALALDELAASAERVRAAAGAKGLRVAVNGVTLEAYLDAVTAAAQRTRRGLDAAGHRPDRIYHAMLDLEDELVDQYARRLARSEALSPGTRAALVQLRERLEDVLVGKGYTKTLDMQWTMSHMAMAIVLAATLSLGVAFATSLAYGPATVEALGLRGAALLVAGAVALVALPLAAFGAFLLRVLFINQFTLPSAGFVLGPGDADVLETEQRGSAPRAAAGRSLPPPT